MMQEKVLSLEDWWDSLSISEKILIASKSPRSNDFTKDKNEAYEVYLIKAKLDMI